MPPNPNCLFFSVIRIKYLNRFSNSAGLFRAPFMKAIRIRIYGCENSLKFFQATLFVLIALRISGGVSNFSSARFPKVTKTSFATFPCLASALSRSRLACEYSLLGFLGVNLWANLSASIVLTVLSIQPKQSASSTASLYGMRGCPVCFL